MKLKQEGKTQSVNVTQEKGKKSFFQLVTIVKHKTFVFLSI